MRFAYLYPTSRSRHNTGSTNICSQKTGLEKIRGTVPKYSSDTLTIGATVA